MTPKITSEFSRALSDSAELIEWVHNPVVIEAVAKMARNMKNDLAGVLGTPLGDKTPSESDFKVGDRVRRKSDALANPFVTPGEVYEIVAVKRTGVNQRSDIQHRDDRGKPIWFLGVNYELVTDALEPKSEPEPVLEPKLAPVFKGWGTWA